jgi:chemotaxis family two-component system response regulator PixG
MIRAVITEVLFDVAQAMQVTSQVKEDSSLSTSLMPIDVQEAIAEAYQLWQVWRNAMVADYSLNSAPIIKQPEKLRERTSAPVYQNLSRVLNGQYTLRDLASIMKRDVMEVTRSLQFYIQLGLVELINVADLPAPVNTPVAKKPTAIATPGGFLVACVDDSPLVCQTMEALLVAAGYQFVGVNDALRAFSILLTRKPDLVFLDLVMPNTNGYEICSKLRKLPSFQNTPIVILTGNDGIVDRVRAKLVGASDFLSKPVDAETVLGVIRKHLRQESISN